MVPPGKIYEVLPMTFPLTHIYSHNGTKIQMVVRCPIAEWTKNGEPYMTAAGWAKLCLMIAKRKPDHLGSLFNCAHELSVTNFAGEDSPTVASYLSGGGPHHGPPPPPPPGPPPGRQPPNPPPGLPPSKTQASSSSSGPAPTTQGVVSRASTDGCGFDR